MRSPAIRRRYGYGAARLCIRVEPYRPPGSHEPARALWAAGDAGAWLVLGTLVAAVVLHALMRERGDDPQLQIVPFETAALPEPEPIPEPEPEPIREPEPVPPRPEVSRPLPVAPPPEPVRPAAPPPPPPERKAEPPRLPRPEPVVVAVAKPPEPPPPARALPRPEPVRPLPTPAARPRAQVQIDQVARAEKPEPTRAPRRSFKTATPRQTRAPAVRVDPVPSAPAAASVPAEFNPRPVRRSSRPATTAARTPRAPNRAVAIDSVRERRERAPASPARSTRSAPVEQPVRTAPASAPRPDLPSLATTRARPATAASRRARPAPAQTAPRERSEPAEPLEAVPLGSLAACVSDREEHRLKQRVLGAVSDKKECVSADGRYRFVETKNLNAFLMWIERARGRAVLDRCGELELALECLGRHSTARGGRP